MFISTTDLMYINIYIYGVCVNNRSKEQGRARVVIFHVGIDVMATVLNIVIIHLTH